MPYAHSGSVRIHYRVEGEGPALVLQHGFSESVVDWYEAGYVDALRPVYRLILIDARGHGASWTRWKSRRPLIGAIRWAGGSASGLPNMPRREFALW